MFGLGCIILWLASFFQQCPYIVHPYYCIVLVRSLVYIMCTISLYKCTQCIYLFYCWQIFGLFPVCGYHKQFCSEYSCNIPRYKCAHISLGVKNCGRFEIILCLHAKKSICHSFMNVGKWHKIPGSKAKDNIFFTAVVRARKSAFAVVLWALKVDTRRTRWMPVNIEVCITEEEP